LVNGVVRQLESLGEAEIEADTVGELVMAALKALDPVAYIRFASVYLSFEDIQAFQDAIHRLAAEPTPEMHQRQVPLIDEDS
jgi:transcriptional repressor NrdR